MFGQILTTKLKGKEYNHVISFGDNDSFNDYNRNHYEKGDRPCWWTAYNEDHMLACGHQKIVQGSIKVHNVHHYHTNALRETGYAKWCKVINPGIKEFRNKNWCKGIKDYDRPFN